nr:LuxR C-terminal-related transcriptional regulator [Actinomadura physcomitrii]
MACGDLAAAAILAGALDGPGRQIAEALFISARTAGVHVSNILAKLGSRPGRRRRRWRTGCACSSRPPADPAAI